MHITIEVVRVAQLAVVAIYHNTPSGIEIRWRLQVRTGSCTISAGNTHNLQRRPPLKYNDRVVCSTAHTENCSRQIVPVATNAFQAGHVLRTELASKKRASFRSPHGAQTAILWSFVLKYPPYTWTCWPPGHFSYLVSLIGKNTTKTYQQTDKMKSLQLSRRSQNRSSPLTRDGDVICACCCQIQPQPSPWWVHGED